MSLAPTHDAASAVVGQCEGPPEPSADGRDIGLRGTQDSATIPGAIQERKSRSLPDGSVIEFEHAPAGWLTQDGEIRLRDHHAYYFTPSPGCLGCSGSGRIPSVKRPGGTIQCAACKGSGIKRERLPSVTTILDAILPKGGLPIWAEARGIEGAVRAVILGEITDRTDPGDGVKIVRDLKLGADRARDTAADRGINVHALLEVYMRTGEPPSIADHPVEHHGYLQSLCAWLLKRNPEAESIEDLVCDPAAGYAGRSDLVARCSGVRIRWDAKTQERGQIYSSAHLQVRMYERAAVACGDEPCDELRVIVFPADGSEAREMPCEASDRAVERALAYYEDLKPVDSICESWNRKARKDRA